MTLSADTHYPRRRIGLAPNVSIPGASLSSSAVSASPPMIGQQILTTQTRPDTANSNSQVDVVIGRPSVGQYNTAPERANGNANRNKPDEFGVTRTTGEEESNVSFEHPDRILAQTIGGTPGVGASIGRDVGRIAPQASETIAIARPRASSARSGPQERRFTVTNLNEAEAAEHHAREQEANASRANSTSAATHASSRPPTAPNQGVQHPRGFLSAEDEKRQLYEMAVERVKRVQDVPMPRPLSPVRVSSVVFPYVVAALSSLTCHFSPYRLPGCGASRKIFQHSGYNPIATLL